MFGDVGQNSIINPVILTGQEDNNIVYHWASSSWYAASFGPSFFHLGAQLNVSFRASFRIQEECLHWCLEANADLLSPTRAYTSSEEISTGMTVQENFSIFTLLIQLTVSQAVFIHSAVNQLFKEKDTFCFDHFFVFCIALKHCLVNHFSEITFVYFSSRMDTAFVRWTDMSNSPWYWI